MIIWRTLDALGYLYDKSEWIRSNKAFGALLLSLSAFHFIVVVGLYWASFL